MHTTPGDDPSRSPPVPANASGLSPDHRYGPASLREDRCGYRCLNLRSHQCASHAKLEPLHNARALGLNVSVTANAWLSPIDVRRVRVPVPVLGRNFRVSRQLLRAGADGTARRRRRKSEAPSRLARRLLWGRDCGAVPQTKSREQDDCRNGSAPSPCRRSRPQK
jgi:hypothetical protein